MSLIQSAYLTILKNCSKLQLLKTQPQIIGITGSAGKSSAVLATYLVLQAKYGDQVAYTKKGNSETGIPFEILNIPVENYQGVQWLRPLFLAFWHLLTYWPSVSFFVIEMGIDSDKSPKNMSYQLGIIQPNVGVLLNVSSVHGQNFSGLDIVQAVANEKRKLLTSLSSSGLAIFSADHEQILKNNPIIQSEKQTFSINTEQSADIVLKTYKVGLTGTEYIFTYQKHEYQLLFKNQLHTKAAFGGFAAALLIGQRYEVPLEEAMTALTQHFFLPPGRMSFFEGISHTTLIDSSYNSSPEATVPALEMVGQIKTVGRKIVVLGDMRELGPATETAHHKIATMAEKNADIIIWVGELSQKYCYEFLKSQKTKKTNLAFKTAWEAIEPIKELIQPKDVILFKGSQNTILLEIIVEALLKNSADVPLLCRRSEYWQKQRQELKKKEN